MLIRNTSITVVVLLAATTIAGFSQGEKDAGPKIMRAQAGYYAKVRDRFWSPMSIRVKNPGPAISTVAEVSTEGRQSNQKVTVRRKIDIPNHALRTFDLPVYTDFGVGGSITNIPFIPVSLTDGGIHTWSTLESFAGVFGESRITILCSDARQKSYRFLDELKLADDRLSSGRTLSKPNALPQRPVYFSPFDIIILGDLGEAEIRAPAMNDTQASSLRQWVETGGTLIVTGTNPTQLENTRLLSHLLPATVSSSRIVERLSFLDNYGDKFLAMDGIHRHRLVPTDGTTLLGPEEDPVAVERLYGRGRIVMVSFDMSNATFQHWDGAPAFVHALLPTMNPMGRYASRIIDADQTIQTLLGELIGKKVPTRRTVLVYLLIVGALLLIPVFAMAHRNRPERAWSATVILALILGFGALIMAQSSEENPKTTLNEVYLAEGISGQAGLNVQSAVGIFSPNDQTIALRAPSETFTLRPSKSKIRPPVPMLFDIQDNRLETRFSIHANDLRYLYFEGAENAFTPPQVNFSYGAEGLKVGISKLPDPVPEEAFLVVRRLVVPLDNLASIPADSISQLVRPNTASRKTIFTKRTIKRTRDEMRDKFRKLFFGSHDSSFAAIKPSAYRLIESYTLPRPSLYAWSSLPVLALPEFGEHRSFGLHRTGGIETFVDGPMVFPQGTLVRNTTAKKGGLRTLPTGAIRGQSSHTILFHWRPPPGAPPLEAQAVRLFCDLESKGYAHEIFLIPATQQDSLPKDLKDGISTDSFESIGTVREWEVAPPTTYFNQEKQQVSAVIRIQKKNDPKASGPPTLHTRFRPWTLNNFEVELEGKPL